MMCAGGDEGFKSILDFSWVGQVRSTSTKAERAGVIEPGDEKVLGRLWPSSTLKELIERRDRYFLNRQIVTAWGTMVLN